MKRSELNWLLAAVLYLATIAISFQIQSIRFEQVSNNLQQLGSAQVEFQLRSEPKLYLARFASDQEQIQHRVAVKLLKIQSSTGELKLSVPATAIFQTDDFNYYRGQTLRATSQFAPGNPKTRSCCLLKIQGTPELVAQANWAFKFAKMVRSNLHAAMKLAPDNGAALVPGLVLGDTAKQSTELEVAMRGSGLAHLTAVSGGNVTIVLGLFIAIFSLLGLARYWLVAVAVAALAAYVLAVGFDASVMRAAAMGSITLLAFTLKSAVTTGKILVAAVYVLTAFNPWLIINWGFLLSVTATASLIWFAPRLLKAMPWRYPFNLAAALLAATVAASWLTAPLLAIMTSSVPVVSILANLLAAPLVAITTVLGLIAALLALINPGLAVPLSAVASLPAELIAQIALKTAALPGAQLELASNWQRLLLAVLVGLVVGLISYFRTAKSTLLLLLVIVLSWPIMVAGFRIIDGWPPKQSFLIACDVGQGTAIIVPLPDNSALLLDVGPDPKLINQCLAKADITKLAAVFISHFHADHAAGLAGALANRKLGRIFVSPNLEPAHQSDAVWQLANKRGLVPEIISAGTELNIQELQVRVLWPALASTPSNENDASLILLIKKAGFSFLFTGDIEPAGQQQLMQQHEVDVDVALVPHHGSKFQAPEFANWTKAEFGLISVGVNNFGHPAQQTLQSWQSAKLLRTDLLGDFALISTPTGLVAVSR